MSFSLKYACFIFTMEAEHNTRLPLYKGSVLRGSLGHAFKRLACLTRRGICRDCMFIPRCSYAYVFETPSETVRGYINHHYVPHPFILEPPLDSTNTYVAGDKLEFVLLLFGRGLDYLPFFIASFEQAAMNGLGPERGIFKLIGVEQLISGRSEPVWRGGYSMESEPVAEELTVSPDFDDANIQMTDEITLELQTPARFIKDNVPAGGISFNMLMRSIFRRLDYLGRAHGSGPLDVPFQELLTQAEKVQVKDSNLTWFDWSRYSERQKKHLLMGGLTGSITFSGRLRPFLQFLRIAQVVHVGKGTVYGMGKVAIL